MEKGSAQDLRSIAASVARDLALSLRLASLRMEGFEPGQGKHVARQLVEQLRATLRRAVELYHLESLTEAVAISEGPLQVRRKEDLPLFESGIASLEAMRSRIGGCYNKVGFTLLLECEVERARRNRAALSVVLLKIDPPDAALLEEVAGHARESYRLLDVLGTFEGRAVGMLLPDTPREGAQIAAQRVLSSYSAARNLADARKADRLTIGLATYPEDGREAGELLTAADARAGGDAVVQDVELRMSNVDLFREIGSEASDDR